MTFRDVRAPRWMKWIRLTGLIIDEINCVLHAHDVNIIKTGFKLPPLNIYGVHLHCTQFVMKNVS